MNIVFIRGNYLLYQKSLVVSPSDHLGEGDRLRFKIPFDINNRKMRVLHTDGYSFSSRHFDVLMVRKI